MGFLPSTVSQPFFRRKSVPTATPGLPPQPNNSKHPFGPQHRLEFRSEKTMFVHIQTLQDDDQNIQNLKGPLFGIVLFLCRRFIRRPKITHAYNYRGSRRLRSGHKFYEMSSKHDLRGTGFLLCLVIVHGKLPVAFSAWVFFFQDLGKMRKCTLSSCDKPPAGVLIKK